MTTETNAERIQIIKMRTEGLLEFEKDIGSQDVNINKICEDLNWLIEQADKNTVKVIKKRKGKATVIEWNGERYAYQSESSAKGGHRNEKRIPNLLGKS